MATNYNFEYKKFGEFTEQVALVTEFSRTFRPKDLCYRALTPDEFHFRASAVLSEIAEALRDYRRISMVMDALCDALYFSHGAAVDAGWTGELLAEATRNKHVGTFFEKVSGLASASLLLPKYEPINQELEFRPTDDLPFKALTHFARSAVEQTTMYSGSPLAVAEASYRLFLEAYVVCKKLLIRPEALHDMFVAIHKNNMTKLWTIDEVRERFPVLDIGANLNSYTDANYKVTAAGDKYVVKMLGKVMKPPSFVAFDPETWVTKTLAAGGQIYVTGRNPHV